MPTTRPLDTLPRTDSQDHLRATPFLPEHPVVGYRGFYPCPGDHAAIVRLPLPLRTVTVQSGWVAVRAKAMFQTADGASTNGQPVFNNLTVRLTPAEAIKILFCSTGVSLAHLGMERADGSVAFASWRQDTRTGAFAIFVGAYPDTSPSNAAVIQGGYQGHMPAGVRWLEESYGRRVDAWQFDSAALGVSSFC